MDSSLRRKRKKKLDLPLLETTYIPKSTEIKQEKGNTMINYIVRQIYERKLQYSDIIQKYPSFKSAIDKALTDKGYSEFIK